MRVRIHRPSDVWGNCLHLRHFYEAMIRSPLADVAWETEPDEPRDFTFDRPGAKTGKTVLRSFGDPHGHPADIMVESLLDPEMVRLAMSLHGRDFPKIDGPEFFREASEGPPGSFVWLWNSYDILMPLLDQSLARLLRDVARPRLGTWWVPWAVPEGIFGSTLSEGRSTDVTFQGAAHYFYPLRYLVRRELRERGAALGITFYLPAHHAPHDVPSPPHEFDALQERFARGLKQAKCSVFDGSVFNYPVARYVEGMACGCLGLAPLPTDAEALGFVDGETMVAVDGENWLDTLRSYLAWTEERTAITRRAKALFDANYSCAAQVPFVLGALEKLRDGARLDEVQWTVRRPG